MSQNCAQIFGKKLHVYNMNQSSDAIDLIGGFKPIDVRLLLKKLLTKYIKNFSRIAKATQNQVFLENLKTLFQNRSYGLLLKCLIESFEGIRKKLDSKFSQDRELVQKWTNLMRKIEIIYNNKDKIESNLAFHFVQGNLIKAIKNGGRKKIKIFIFFFGLFFFSSFILILF